MEITDGNGVDVVYEHVGGELFQKGLDSLAKDGRLVICGGHSGEVVPFDIIPFFRMQRSVIGSFVYTTDEVERCYALAAHGQIKPLVHATFPLAEANRPWRRWRGASTSASSSSPRRAKESADETCGCRRRRDLHRPDLRRRRGRGDPGSQASDHACGPLARHRAGHRRGRGAGGGEPGRARPGVPRHDDRDEHRDRAQRRHGRDDHDRGLPRHPPHRAPQEAPQLLELPGPAVAAVPGRPASLPPHGAGAHHEGRLGARPARRGEGARAGPQAEGGRGRGGRGVLPVLVPEPGARAARRRDRARGVPGGVPVRVLRGAAPVPGVRALLDRRPQRLRRPEGRPLRRPARGGAARART